MDLSFNNKDLSFVTFGSDIEEEVKDNVESPSRTNVDPNNNDITKNSKCFGISENYLDSLGDDIIGDYLKDADTRISEITKVKNYEKPTLVLNSHKSETITPLEQKTDTNDFQIKHANDFYSLRDSLERWLKSYQNYNLVEFLQFDDKFRPNDLEFVDGRLLLQTEKNTLLYIDLHVFSNGIVRLAKKETYNFLNCLITDQFGYYDQFDDEIEDFYQINLLKWKSNKKTFTQSKYSKYNDRNKNEVFRTKNIFNNHFTFDENDPIVSPDISPRGSKISPEARLKTYGQSDKVIVTPKKFDMSNYSSQGKLNVPSRFTSASQDSSFQQKMNVFKIENHDYDNLLCENTDAELSMALNNSNVENSGFSDGDSFLTTKSNMRKEAQVTHPFLLDYILVFNGKVLEDRMIGKGFYINGNLFYDGKWVDSYPSSHCVELFYPNNTIWYKGGMKKGKKKSFGIEYWQSGLKKVEAIFRDGEIHDTNAKTYSNEGYLEFTGKFIKGVRNGHGESYYKNGNIKMSGNWSNLLCSSKTGKIYYEEDGSLKYSGSLVNNNRDGFGTEYHPNSNIKYTGVFVSGKYEDKNVSILDEKNNIVYKGDLINGNYNGYGILYHENSKKKHLEGKFVDDLLDDKMGRVYEKNETQIYLGEMSKGKKHGKGNEFHSNGKLKVEGNYKNDLQDDENVEIYFENSKTQYKGGYSNGKKAGNGVEYYQNGKIKFEGSFVNDQFNGNAVKVRNDQGIVVYWGSMVEGVFSGKGIEYYDSGKMKAIGNFKDGALDDEAGKTYNDEGVLQYQGNFKNGVKEGEICEFYEDGSLKCTGKYQNNKKVGLFHIFYQYQIKTKDGIKDYDLDQLYNNYLKELKRKCFSSHYKFPIRYIIIYDNDVKTNIVLEFYENKKVRMLGKYKDNILSKKISLFDKNGFLGYKGEHLNTIPNGHGVKYYENCNSKHFVGTFKNGLPDGNSVNIFDKVNGNLIYSGQMKQGTIEGKGKRYNPNNGKLRLKGVFSEGLLHGDNCKVYDKFGNQLYHGAMNRNKRHGLGNLYFNLKFLTQYQYKKRFGMLSFGILWGLSAILPASLIGGVAWRFSLIAAELTSYTSLASILGVSTGTIGTLVMALDNIKFFMKTNEFTLKVDTSKRTCLTDKNKDMVKKWIHDHGEIFQTGNWVNDKLESKDVNEKKMIDLWTKDNLENVKMSYGNVELLDLHLTLS